MARRLAQIGVLGWIIVMPMLAGASRPLARPDVQLRTVLDRSAHDARARARRLVRLEMDEERMSFLVFDALPFWAMLLSLTAHLAAGFVLGVPLFPWPVVERPPVHRSMRGGGQRDDDRLDDRPLRPPCGLLTLASLEGALPLLVIDTRRPSCSFRGHARRSGRHTMTSPLLSVALYRGPVSITAGVVATWAIMAALVLGGILVSRRLSLVPSARPGGLRAGRRRRGRPRIRDTIRVEPAPYRAFIGTLFTLVFVANWSSLVPGVEPPTAHLETDAALALLVFVAVIWFGIRAGGVRRYLAAFATRS